MPVRAWVKSTRAKSEVKHLRRKAVVKDRGSEHGCEGRVAMC